MGTPTLAVLFVIAVAWSVVIPVLPVLATIALAWSLVIPVLAVFATTAVAALTSTLPPSTNEIVFPAMERSCVSALSL